MTNNSERSDLPPSTLIICSRNRPRLLEETVVSVLAGEELPSELLIIDQSVERHPSLGNMNQANNCHVHYVQSHSSGVCRARNEGMAVATHDILVLIDDDMQVPPTWYGSLVRALIQAGPRSVVTGKVLAGEPEKPGSFVPALVTGTTPCIYEGRIGTDVLVSCHMAMYRSAFKQVGGFDERLGPGTRFSSAEDNDYGFRFLEAGYRIVYAPEAMIYHRAWRAAKDYFPLRWSYGRGKGGYYLKYASLRDSYMLRRMMGDILLRVIRFPWRFLHRPQLALGDLVYVSGILAGATEWMWTERGKKPSLCIPERVPKA